MGSKERGSNQIVIASQVPRWRIRRKALASLARTVLSRIGYRNTILSVVFVSDRRLQQLNHRFLGHPWKTDVLTFPFSDLPPFVSIDRMVGGGIAPTECRRSAGTRYSRRGNLRVFIGEILISLERARAQAKRFHVSFNEEVVRYVCHGILHLSGYSDRSLRERMKMRRAEDRLLRFLSAKQKRII